MNIIPCCDHCFVLSPLNSDCKYKPKACFSHLAAYIISPGSLFIWGELYKHPYFEGLLSSLQRQVISCQSEMSMETTKTFSPHCFLGLCFTMGGDI